MTLLVVDRIVCGKGNQSYNERKDEESPFINTTDISTNRIRDIEGRVDLADIEVIPSSTRAQEIYSNTVKSAQKKYYGYFLLPVLLFVKIRLELYNWHNRQQKKEM